MFVPIFLNLGGLGAGPNCALWYMNVIVDCLRTKSLLCNFEEGGRVMAVIRARTVELLSIKRFAGLIHYPFVLSKQDNFTPVEILSYLQL